MQDARLRGGPGSLCIRPVKQAFEEHGLDSLERKTPQSLNNFIMLLPVRPIEHPVTVDLQTGELANGLESPGALRCPSERRT